MRSGGSASRRRAAGALLALGFSSAPRAEVVERALEVEGRIQEVIAVDLDGDRLRDLAVVSASGRSPDATRRLSVFWQGPARSFASRPDLVWEPDPGVAILDLVGIEAAAGGRPAAVYSLGPGGVRAHRFDRARRSVESAAVLALPLTQLVPADDRVAILDFAADWGSGADLFLPALPHPRILRAANGSYRDGPGLEIAPVAAHRVADGEWDLRGRDLTSGYTFPMPVAADQDGDGRKELLFVAGNRVTVFRGADLARGGDAAIPGRAHRLRILDPREADSDDGDAFARLADLEGDGRADLVAVVFRDAGVLEIAGRILVFRARPDGTFSPEPDQVVTEIEDAVWSLAQLTDLDGDGSLELIVPAARLGLLGYLRVLTTRRASVDFHTLAFREGRFDAAGAARDTITLRLSRTFDLPVIKLADIGGDGIVDLVVGAGEDRICVHDGTTRRPGHRFESRPRLCHPADPYAIYSASDLDLDGASELIRHPGRGEERGRLAVTFLGE